MAYICTKIYAGTKKHTPQAILLSKFNSRKIQDGGGRHFEIHFNSHNSVNTKHICTKFGTETKNNIPETELTSYLRKSKMAAAAILKIGLMAISRLLWHIFAQNFIQGLKTIPHKPFCCQNSIPKNSKMATAAILKFTLTAITRSILNTFAQNLAQRLKTTSRRQN